MVTLLTYIRAIIILPLAVVWTAVSSIMVVLLVTVGVPRKWFNWFIIKVWNKVMLVMSGVEVEVKGLENIPSTGFLYVFNHTSQYDIMTVFEGSPRFPFFGAKSELFNIPFFGRAMRIVGALPIERKNREKVLQIYRDAKKRVEQGDVFILAPEGTRQKGHGFLGDFKLGPFIFAIHAQMPIVPLVIVGCEYVLPKKSYLINVGKWKRKVIFDALPAVSTHNMTEENVGELRDRVYDMMKKRLATYWETGV